MIEVILATLIVFVAMLVRGFTGFGGALLTVPLLTLFLDVRLVIVAVAFLQIVTGGTLTILVRQWLARPLLVQTLLWSIAGLAAGTLLLTYMPVAWITRALGVFTVLAGLAMLLRPNLWPASNGESGRGARVAVGTLAGFLQGLIGTGGPVIVPYFYRQLDTARTLRATLLAYFLVLDLLRMGGYVALRVAGLEAFLVGIVLLPGALAGTYAGSKLQVSVSERVFRTGVALVLIGSGVLLLR